MLQGKRKAFKKLQRIEIVFVCGEAQTMELSKLLLLVLVLFLLLLLLLGQFSISIFFRDRDIFITEHL